MRRLMVCVTALSKGKCPSRAQYCYATPSRLRKNAGQTDLSTARILILLIPHLRLGTDSSVPVFFRSLLGSDRKRFRFALGSENARFRPLGHASPERAGHARTGKRRTVNLNP